MLRRWSIANFKSFKGKTDLEFAPITVLAGANSSGKSTIIQSLLLLKQTLQYVPATRSVGLNGPLIKLGKFDDIKNIGSVGDAIEVGWEIDQLSNYRTPNYNSPFHYYPYPARLEAATFAIAFGLEPEPSKNSELTTPSMTNLRQLQPVLLSVSTTVKYAATREGKETVETANLVLKRSKTQKASPETVLPTEFPFQVSVADPTSRRELLQQRPDSKLIGAHVRHFFPSQIGVSFNKSKDFARRMAQEMVSGGRDFLYDPDFPSTKLNKRTVSELLELLREVAISLEGADALQVRRLLDRLESISIDEASAHDFCTTIRETIRRSELRVRQQFRTALTERLEDIETIITDGAALPAEPGYDVGLPRMIGAAADQAGVFFRTRFAI